MYAPASTVQRDFERTAHEVHVSEKRRSGAVDTRRELTSRGPAAPCRAVTSPLPNARAEAVFKRDPDSIDGHTYLAIALENSGETAGAGTHYLRATELAPANGAALSNYGTWLCGQGRTADSLGWFDKAVAEPGYAESDRWSLANAGVCAGQAGQQQRAERDLRRAIALDPSQRCGAWALRPARVPCRHAFEARAFSERRLAAAPANPQALLLASQIEEKLGDRAAAARYVSRLKAEFPDASEARNSSMGDGGRR